MVRIGIFLPVCPLGEQTVPNVNSSEAMAGA